MKISRRSSLYVEMSDEKEALNKMLNIIVATKDEAHVQNEQSRKGSQLDGNQAWTKLHRTKRSGQPGRQDLYFSGGPRRRGLKGAAVQALQGTRDHDESAVGAHTVRKRKKRLELIAERRALKNSAAAASSSDNAGSQAHQHQREMSKNDGGIQPRER